MLCPPFGRSVGRSVGFVAGVGLFDNDSHEPCGRCRFIDRTVPACSRSLVVDAASGASAVVVAAAVLVVLVFVVCLLRRQATKTRLGGHCDRFV